MFSTKKTCPQGGARTFYRACHHRRPHRHCAHHQRLVCDSGVCQATAYRYLHEPLEVIVQRSPDITDGVDRLRQDGEPFVCLDGTLVCTDRVAARSEAGNHLWYSGKHTAFVGNVQVLTDHTRFPVWTGPVEPGSTHDITAARAHALPALYRAASLGLPTLADKGYTGDGIGIKVPAKNPHPDPDTRSPDGACGLITSMRAPAERANALIKHYRGPQARHPRPQSHHRRSPGHPHPPQRPLVRKPHCSF